MKHPELHAELGRLVRQERTRCGLSQERLAEATGLSRSSIANIERGRQNLTVEALFDLALALGVTPPDLLPAPDAASVSRAVSLPGEVGKDVSEDERDWMESLIEEPRRKRK